MRTLLLVQDNTPEVSDLREWSEHQLIAASKTGRRAPFGELCERHGKQVFRVVHRMMRNREDAEDAVQDCLLSAFAHIKDFDERSQFATWLTRIAINAALAKLRRNHWKREIAVDEPTPSETGRQREIQDDAPDPEETYHLRERRQILNKAILRLRPRVRRVWSSTNYRNTHSEGLPRFWGSRPQPQKRGCFTLELRCIECHC